ncbi:MAG: HPt (histidine-containing phosphotransfer) domain-containing protein [Crocinitomix sp.]|jgi:HPt (histidine-containing phosphotransfer) domain-containing protein
MKISQQVLQIRLNKIGNNDTEFIHKLIELFTKNAKKSLVILTQKNPEKSLIEKQQTAHKLKSNFLLFEFEEAFDLASNIENAPSLHEMAPYIVELNLVLPTILTALSDFE